MRRSQKEPIIGIDLGTTFSSVAVCSLSGEPEVIKSNHGNASIPSVVGFIDDQIITGEQADNEMLQNPQTKMQLVYDSKRMIGRNFDDPQVQSKMRSWPFTVVKGEDGGLLYKVKGQNGTKYYSPIDISSYILNELKLVAEDTHLNKSVTKAVITIPADFDDNQRRATKEAGKNAGFECISLIEEPTAAAVAYSFKNAFESAKRILVFDFGGGTLDISLLDVFRKKFVVKGTKGDQNLGGQDIDNNLFEHVRKRFQIEYGYDPIKDQHCQFQLKSQCESAKITLSFSRTQKATIRPCFQHKPEFSYKLTRSKFEEINHDLFQRTLEPVKSILSENNVEKSEVDIVLLVGGSSRIPYVKDLLGKFFTNDIIALDVDPSLTVVKGAAIIASSHGEIVKIENVLTHEIGIEIKGCEMFSVFDKNTKIPVSKEIKVTTEKQQQYNARIRVFMGDNKYTCDNVLLWEYLHGGLEGRIKPEIIIHFDVNEEGLLNIVVKDEDAKMEKEGSAHCDIQHIQ
ncbi:heat shock 70 kDa protein 2 [Histomonas meleagridis]|uniref:heat shock 70 kDa protein 2 n=1 Tax=Histomonas meleagridis TaxID=135588 RepID=UPI003559DE3A|nr:heat shock 70 kDa protein 2 [Histomonas meleagridis]KAH0802914.1 heat shock 70 kDa protein 2 [Histomonas meleagridis]